MQRREFLLAFSSMAMLGATRSWAALVNTVSIMQFSDAGKPLGRVMLPRVSKDAEWKKTLSPLA
ncbi:MAG: peptide-methionine (R)-S-oxide reductase, partial [Gallionella sp.]|nr:peptide-methionine (R)-S-oxide reductase [Gallionella sp.]